MKPASDEIYSVRSARSKRKCAAFFGEAALAIQVGGSASKLASFYGLPPAPQSRRRASGTFGRDAFDRNAAHPRDPTVHSPGRDGYERSTFGRDAYSRGSSRRTSLEPDAAMEAAAYAAARAAHATTRRVSSNMTLNAAAAGPPVPPPRSSHPFGSVDKLAWESEKVRTDDNMRHIDAAVAAVALSQQHRPSVSETVYPGPGSPRSLRTFRSEPALKRSADTTDLAAFLASGEGRIHKALPPLPLSNSSTRKVRYCGGRVGEGRNSEPERRRQARAARRDGRAVAKRARLTDYCARKR
ncbi:hypothetical protein BDK51DRAFT_47895 [Blyttiomyces helicus]|uniref:Uncharacterized protein n=1 Tax=Blyttiomyces helicus TaxID=388810 RepID=A0A4P9W6Q6_9FUNG|nr:hypothetical protein BDK51DRAFT_47895 [Blyttiomyces helicus]|eukprot:RKO88149.1 hypothetical protein BDK51DRAFT_47895 [Blyttiomyces helicus]